MTQDRLIFLSPIVGVLLALVIVWWVTRTSKRSSKRKALQRDLLNMDLTSLSRPQEEQLRRMARRYRINFDGIKTGQIVDTARDKMRAAEREAKRKAALAAERKTMERQKQIEQEAIDSILRDMRGDT